MSSPMYTSETIDNANPRWSSLEVPIVHATGYSTASGELYSLLVHCKCMLVYLSCSRYVSDLGNSSLARNVKITPLSYLLTEIIVRIWKRSMAGDTKADITLFTWGISFTGLAYIGPKLPTNLETILKENSLIFYFHGGYFTPAYCFVTIPDLKRYLCINISMSEAKSSYTVNKLTSLRSKMQALKQQTESVQTLRTRIASGDDFYTPKYPQTTLNRLLQPRKVNREKKAEIVRIRKELEMAKFRTKLLEQERARKMGEIRVLNQLHGTIVEENQDHGQYNKKCIYFMYF